MASGYDRWPSCFVRVSITVRTCRFPADHGLLATGAPMVVTEDAGGSDDAVAGDEEGDRVPADGGADGALRVRTLDAQRDGAVRREMACGDAQKRFPDFQLEGGALEVELDAVELLAAREDRQGALLERIGFLRECRVRKLFVQILQHFLLVVGERYMRDAFRCRGDEDAAERAVGKRIIDGEILAASLIFPRRHAFDRDEEIVQSARAGEARLVRGFQKRCAIFRKQLLCVSEAHVLQEFLRACPGPFRKEPLEMEGAHLQARSYSLKIRLRSEITLDVADGVLCGVEFMLRIFHISV